MLLKPVLATMPMLESETLVYNGSGGVARFCQLTVKLSVFVLF